MDILEIKLANKKINPVDLLITLKFVSSKNEAKRLVEGNGMKVNQEKVNSCFLPSPCGIEDVYPSP